MRSSRSPEADWGQWLWVSLPGDHLDEEDVRWLQQVRPGAVVLFSENGTRAQDVQKLVSGIREALAPSDVWIAIDQEGGRVARLKEGVPSLPPARMLGDGDPAEIYRSALNLGMALRRTGIDIDFAPVLDVDSNPDNPIIGDRSFSRDPWQVARLSMAFSHGLEAGGIIPCGKHFPGHGDTLLDSHLALPSVGASADILVEREFLPFEMGIQEGIPILMTAHVLYPALDKRWPATLSRKIMTDMLRKKWGFRGLLLSDDLSMAAVGKPFPFSVVVERSLAVTCDGLLVLKSREKPLEALKIIRSLAARNPGLWRVRLEKTLMRRAVIEKRIAAYRKAAERIL